MCLIVLPGFKPEIAQEDITCWKTVKPFGKDKWEAPVRNTIHNYDEVLTACDRLNRVEPHHTYGSHEYIIDEGFHAYTDRENAEYVSEVCHSRISVKCTIPAGAEYCLGTGREIVATKMIVHAPESAKHLSITHNGTVQQMPISEVLNES